jgi:hypothetical protein
MFLAGTTQTACEGYFNAINAITQGTDGDTTGNTIACRQTWSAMATATSTHYCIFGGLSGGGRCGNVLTNVANAVDQNCNGVAGYPFANAGAFVTNNTAIQAVYGSLQGIAAASEESLECRLYHSFVGVSVAVHCSHVSFPGVAGAWCGGTVSTDAGHYCTNALATCTGTGRAQYNNMTQCLNSISTFPDGSAVATNAANDKGCRQYHIQAAGALTDQVHCHHGGPSGGGVCGDTNSSRLAWKNLAKVTNCLGTTFGFISASIDQAFAAWSTADLLAVVPMGTDLSTFTVASSGDTDTCRLYHLTVASQDPTHCTHGSILGGGACGTISGASCRMFQTACGTVAFASVSACQTAVDALIAANKTGPFPPAMGATTTDDLNCRVFQAGAALATRKTSTAPAAVAAFCNGLKSPGSTVCGVAPTKSGAPTLVASALVMLPAIFAL